MKIFMTVVFYYANGIQTKINDIMKPIFFSFF